jgi:hypothetical protein
LTFLLLQPSKIKDKSTIFVCNDVTFIAKYNTSEKVKQKIVKLVICYLLESIGEPSSNISSTTSGSAYSDLFVLKGTSRDLLRNILLNAILLGLLGGLGIGAIFSGGRMSITMQVVSSLIPRGRVAS